MSDKSDPISDADVSDNERWYDEEIAPALQAIGRRCEEHGRAFVAVVEFEPGSQGRTCILPEGAGLGMVMINLCAQTVTNVDRYLFSLARYCREHDVDTSASIALTQLLGGRPS
jgi:hypothetical protein